MEGVHAAEVGHDLDEGGELDGLAEEAEQLDEHGRLQGVVDLALDGGETGDRGVARGKPRGVGGEVERLGVVPIVDAGERQHGQLEDVLDAVEVLEQHNGVLCRFLAAVAARRRRALLLYNLTAALGVWHERREVLDILVQVRKLALVEGLHRALEPRELGLVRGQGARARDELRVRSLRDVLELLYNLLVLAGQRGLGLGREGGEIAAAQRW